MRTTKRRSRRVGINYSDTSRLKTQLQEEIVKLERQLLELRLSDGAADFAKLSSYEEMITARRTLLRRLPR